MSVKAVIRRGNPVWRVQVLRDRGKFNRRRFLDRRTVLKREALEVEAELIAEYEASKRGGEITHNTTPATPEPSVEPTPPVRIAVSRNVRHRAGAAPRKASTSASSFKQRARQDSKITMGFREY